MALVCGAISGSDNRLVLPYPVLQGRMRFEKTCSSGDFVPGSSGRKDKTGTKHEETPFVVFFGPGLTTRRLHCPQEDSSEQKIDKFF